MVGTPGEGEDGVGVVDKGEMEGLDTRVETGISFELDKEDFLILALNLLSIVNFRLRFEVLMGPLLLLNFSLELTKEFPPNFPWSLKVRRSGFTVLLEGLVRTSLFSSSLSMKDRGGVTFSFFLG